MTDRIQFPQSRCLVGVADGDVTPPVGTYHRMWGAAAHDRSTGVHRPLRQTTLVLAPPESHDVVGECALFIALDHCLFGTPEMENLLDHLTDATGIGRERIVVFFSHTHGAGLLGRDRVELPGGENIPAYLDWLAEHLASSATAALRRVAPATFVYGIGHCGLATNRDYVDEGAGQSVCGYNPDGTADATVLIARITDDAMQRTIGTLVNYACHPTTLAWDNTLISPDYVGAMRDVIERTTEAQCFFVQGASGDVGPREGFVGDVGVADSHGRQLGYAVLSAAEDLPPAGTQFQYRGPVVSGATIGTWDYQRLDERRSHEIGTWSMHRSTVPLPYRSDRLDARQLEQERARWELAERDARAEGDDAKAADARAMIERMTRRLTRTASLPPGDSYPYPLRLWRIGDAVWVALDGEHYNVLQRRLREHFPETPLIIGTLANGSSVWYLPDKDSYGKGLYQEDASVLAQGSLETLIGALTTEITNLLDD